MPIETQCQKCSRKFRVPDKFAGKRVKCPKCEGTIEIPRAAAAEAEAPKPQTPAAAAPTPRKAPQAPAAKKAPPEQWHVQTEDGEQYGPVSREELDSWVADGRIDGSCQLLQEGWDQWKWAEEVFPELAEGAAETTPPVVAVQGDSPFAGIGETPAAADNPFEAPQAAVEPPGVSADDGSGVTQGARRALNETKPWVTFLAILGFVAGGLATLSGLGLFFVFSFSLGARGVVIGLLFLVAPAISLVLSYYLFSYGQRIFVYLRSNKAIDLEAALVAQKSFWKLSGIVTACVLAFYLIMTIIAWIMVQQASSAMRDAFPGM